MLNFYNIICFRIHVLSNTKKNNTIILTLQLKCVPQHFLTSDTDNRSIRIGHPQLLFNFALQIIHFLYFGDEAAYLQYILKKTFQPYNF